MGTAELRDSDRVYLELPITLSGADAAGREFVEHTTTLVVSQRGAKIVSQHALVPQRRLRIRCLKTGHVSDLRVAGPIAGDQDGYYYGVEVLDAGTDFWGISFPSLTPAGNAASRVLLECMRCQSQEVVHLDVFELEVLLANECLMRPCSICTDTRMWVPLMSGRGKPATGGIVSDGRRPVHERKGLREDLKVDVCIRHRPQGEEVVVTESVSRGGFRFRSSRHYPVPSFIEVALPYVPGAANIFAPARIVSKEDHPGQPTRTYCVAYVPSHMALSLTGMRISSPDEPTSSRSKASR